MNTEKDKIEPYTLYSERVETLRQQLAGVEPEDRTTRRLDVLDSAGFLYKYGRIEASELCLMTAQFILAMRNELIDRPEALSNASTLIEELKERWGQARASANMIS
jgi:hypothetical protein